MTEPKEKTMPVLVESGDERPARPDGSCYYCRQPIGTAHLDGCVIVCRWVA